jgi:hypothetical protein
LRNGGSEDYHLKKLVSQQTTIVINQEIWNYPQSSQ